MQNPIYTPEEALTRETFLTLLWSLSYPGKGYSLPHADLDVFRLIGDTLLDIETSFYTSDESLIPYLKRNGARDLSPNRAAYHMYPTLSENMLETVQHASTGNMLYPDASATLVIGCELDAGQTLELKGPGIPPGEVRIIQVAGVPNGFWRLREQANTYPLGWDIYLVSDRQVVGLPRTTQVKITGES